MFSWTKVAAILGLSLALVLPAAPASALSLSANDGKTTSTLVKKKGGKKKGGKKRGGKQGKKGHKKGHKTGHKTGKKHALRH